MTSFCRLCSSRRRRHCRGRRAGGATDEAVAERLEGVPLRRDGSNSGGQVGFIVVLWFFLCWAGPARGQGVGSARAAGRLPTRAWSAPSPTSIQRGSRDSLEGMPRGFRQNWRKAGRAGCRSAWQGSRPPAACGSPVARERLIRAQRWVFAGPIIPDEVGARFADYCALRGPPPQPFA